MIDIRGGRRKKCKLIYKRTTKKKSDAEKVSCATLCRHINARRWTTVNETTVRRRVAQNKSTVHHAAGGNPLSKLATVANSPNGTAPCTGNERLININNLNTSSIM